VPTLASTVAVFAVAWGLYGARAAWGAALGGAVVLVFFGIDLLAMRISAGWDPALTFLLVMVEYLIKIVALALFLVGLRGGDPAAVDPRWVGIGLAVAGVVFLSALVVAYLRVPTFVADPGAE
jgi:ATP synthase protein I